MQENTLSEDAESPEDGNFEREDSESPEDSNFDHEDAELSGDGSFESDDSDSPDNSNFECSNDPPGNEADTDMDTPLKATGKTSRAEALLMILTYAARHQITGSALDDLLKLINHLFGQDVVPASKYAFNKVFQRNMDKVEFHLYCKDCKTTLGSQNEVLEKAITECSACNSPVDPNTLNNGGFFISVPIAPQIQNILHTPELQTKLSYRVDRPGKAGNIISDIYDGDLYKVLSAPGEILSDPNNLSYTFNSDGSPLYKSSRFSIWPIHLHLNELPPNIRFKHVILAGLWFGSTEPQMHVFLKPFVDQAKVLATKGVSWKKDERVVISKVVGLCCCVDSKARPAMQNCTQFNGYFGCGFCLHPGTLVNRQVKYPISESDYPDRDAESMLKDMEKALNLKKNVRGVKGPSHLINMPFFDIVWGFAPDYMHAVLLGVARQHAALLLESADEPYYIGNPSTLRVLNDRLQKIKPPHPITRLPRSISDFKTWKASEWRNWLLFYSLPCLEGLIDVKYTKHLCLLVSAIYLLLQEEVSFEEVNKADEMLLEFVIRFQALFGEASMTSNVHLLTHLAKSVKLLGPLWAHSAFVFESANGSLLKLVHGTKDVPKQIVGKFLLHKSIPYFSAKHRVSDRVLGFCSQITDNSKVQSYKKWDNTTVLDGGRVRHLTQAECQAFDAAGKQPSNEIFSHKRMIHQGIVFTSHDYSRAKRRNDWCVRLDDGSRGQLHQILSYDVDGETELGLLLIPFYTLPAAFPQGLSVPHIACVRQGDRTKMQLISVHRLYRKCLVIECAEKVFVCDLPNSYERD